MMYLILLRYVVPLTELHAILDEHRAFLRRHYVAGHFLLSGPCEPRDGGVIIARAASRAELETWIREDPFVTSGSATVEIVAWHATMRAEGIHQDLASGSTLAATSGAPR